MQLVNNQSFILSIVFLFCTIQVARTEYVGLSCFDRLNNLDGTCRHIRDCGNVLLRKYGNRPYTPCGYENSQEIVCCGERVHGTSPYMRRSNAITNQIQGRPCFDHARNLNGTCKYISDCRDVYALKHNNRAYARCGYENAKEVVCCAERVQSMNLHWRADTTRRYVRECEKYKSQMFDRILSFTNLVAYAEQTKMQVSNCSQYTFPLVVGGEDANPKEFPHMALLGCPDGKGGKNWICGGTLISSKYVLTAAHCIADASCDDITHVRLGELHLNSTQDDARPIDYRVEKSIPHPNYKLEMKYDDIALIKLTTDVEFNEYVRPACLPYEDNIKNAQLLVTGWGSIEHAGIRHPHLQKAPLEIFTQVECNKIWAEVEDFELPTGIRERAQLCAGSRKSNKDSCTGDSGGPLQIIHLNHPCMYSVVGITSAGQGCGNAGIPGIYTNTFNYINWIERTVWG